MVPGPGRAGGRERRPAAAGRASAAPPGGMGADGPVPKPAFARPVRPGHALGDLLGHGRIVPRHRPGDHRSGLHESAAGHPSPPRQVLLPVRVGPGRFWRRPDLGLGDGRLPPLPGAPEAIAGDADRSEPLGRLSVSQRAPADRRHGVCCRGAADCRGVPHRGPGGRRRRPGGEDPRAGGNGTPRAAPRRQRASGRSTQPHRSGRAGLPRRNLGAGRLWIGQGVCTAAGRFDPPSASVRLVAARLAGLRADRVHPLHQGVPLDFFAGQHALAESRPRRAGSRS